MERERKRVNGCLPPTAVASCKPERSVRSARRLTHSHILTHIHNHSRATHRNSRTRNTTKRNVKRKNAHRVALPPPFAANLCYRSQKQPSRHSPPSGKRREPPLEPCAEIDFFLAVFVRASLAKSTSTIIRLKHRHIVSKCTQTRPKRCKCTILANLCE